MLKGKELILATRRFAKDDKRKSWFYTIQTFAFLLIALFLVFLSNNIFVQAIFSILSGLLMVRSFVIYHDYMHETILRKSKIAKWIFQTFGVFILAPKSVWKASHSFHHQNNSKLRFAAIGSYPILTKKLFEQSSKNAQRNYLFTRHPLTIIFGHVFSFIIGMCLNPLRSNFKKHLDAMLAILLHLVIYVIAFYYVGVLKTLLLITIPHGIAGAIGSYLFYIQHNFPSTTFKQGSEWSYECAAMESSSFLNTSLIIHWFTANIGYHHIHHLNARIPFYRLPETMKYFPALQSPKTISLTPSDIVRCLKLKVWDAKLKKMVNVKL